jgi:hypothetical protein
MGAPKNYKPRNTTRSFLNDIKFYKNVDTSLRLLKDIEIYKTEAHLNCIFYDKIVPKYLKKNGKYYLLEKVCNDLIIEKYQIHCNRFKDNTGHGVAPYSISENYLIKSIFVFTANHPNVDYRDGHYCFNPDYYETFLNYHLWRSIREDLHHWNLDHCYYAPGKEFYKTSRIT